MFFKQSIAEVLEALHTRLEGLSQADAAKRLEQDGPNELTAGKSVAWWTILLQQFSGVLIIILIVAAAVSAVLGEYVDAIAIGVIVLLNGILGFIQEYQAERSIEALKKIESPHAIVIRDGQETEIDARQVVCGDVLVLSEGDKVAADGRLVEEHHLHIDESLFTGESLPVTKDTEAIDRDVSVADQENMVFAGCAVTRGRGLAIVVRTGMATEMGKIATQVQEAEKPMTPLQKSLNHLGKILALLCLAVAVPGFVLGVLEGQDVFEMFLVAVSLAVSAIPEGLPMVVTIALALGTKRMLRSNALVRRLPVVETLGGTDVICTDKTGTLTENRMTVTTVSIAGRAPDGWEMKSGVLDGLEQLTGWEQVRDEYTRAAALCNDATADLGDPTEKALIVLADQLGYDANRLASFDRVDEIPFSSEDKYMVTLNVVEGDHTVFMKGASEKVLEHCTQIWIGSDLVELDDSGKQVIIAEVERLSSQALRVLALARRTQGDQAKLDQVGGLEFIGLVGMMDPPRQEVKEAMKICRGAHIRVVMITGDHALTAQAIGEQIGLDVSNVMTGAELDQLQNGKWNEIVEQVNVFARVSPQHKLHILEALQENGHVVAMTGDGVNDAPAVKQADIGLAVGSGTEITKEVSDMILLDDNFATISKAIEEGRQVFANIKKFFRLLLSTNFDEIFLIFTSILFRFPLPLIPIQILWLNLATDSLPALALAVDNGDPNAMGKKPYDAKKEIFKGVFGFTLIVGIMAFIASLLMFLLAYYLMDYSLEHARTMVLMVTIVNEYFIVFSCRGEKSAFELGIFSNKYLWYAIGIGMIMQAFILYTPPMQTVFRSVALGVVDWLLVLIFAASGFVVIETYRALRYGLPRKGQTTDAR